LSASTRQFIKSALVGAFSLSIILRDPSLQRAHLSSPLSRLTIVPVS
jgi:hypothetical protein